MSTISGSVNANGTPASGEGFSSSLVNTGNYKITFNNPFEKTPTVSVSPSAGYSGYSQNITIKSCNIEITSNNTRMPADGAFGFSASDTDDK